MIQPQKNETKGTLQAWMNQEITKFEMVQVLSTKADCYFFGQITCFCGARMFVIMFTNVHITPYPELIKSSPHSHTPPF
jgi:hypothetical protein